MLFRLSAIISRLNHRYERRYWLAMGLVAVLLFVAGNGRALPTVAAYLAPPVVDDQTFTVMENSATGTAVGTVIATNANSYAITAGNGSGAFAINPATGLLTVADGTQIDYEITPSFSLTVQVSNPEGTDTGIMTINVLNINDAPTVNDQTFNVTENSANGTSLGFIAASDPDGNSGFYTILFVGRIE